MARHPKNGLASGSRFRYGMDLSPPASNVRIMRGRPPKAFAVARYVWYCSSSSGADVRFRNRNSVRNNPTPSAPDSTATCAPATEPIFAAISTVLPSRVTAGAALSRRALFFACRRVSAFIEYWLIISGAGSIKTFPFSPSKMIC